MMKWTTKDGKKIEVKKMSTSHIKNALALLKRRGFISPETLEFYFSCRWPTADGALMAFENELDSVLKSPTSPFIDYFEDELTKRANNV